jgi:predicted DNA-binding transcriptional regulator AlpA
MTRQAALPPTLPPRLIGREAAAAYVCVAPSTFDAMVSEGRMPKPRELTPRRWAWDVRELDCAVDALPRRGTGERAPAGGDGETPELVPADDFGWDD